MQMTASGDALEVRRRKLMYRSTYTGTKETDILLSRFAARNLPTFSERQLDLYEHMLTAGDPEIMAWVMKRKPVPSEFDNEVSRLLIRFDFTQMDG
jgi:succinate dehydrogenase flavin-adding protein (antitoxin of CptAB toxin-antitoxin module)